MHRRGFDRPKPLDRSRERFRIPRDDGRSQFMEAMAMLSMLVVLTIVLGLAVGVPLAMMLNDFCTTIKC